MADYSRDQAAQELKSRGVTLDDLKGYFLRVAEPALAMGSGIVAEPLSGLAGLAALPYGADNAAKAVEFYSDALTYSPRTDSGRAGMQAVGDALAPIGEALESVSSGAGDYVYDKTGSPALATAAYSAPTAAMELLGLKGVNAASKAGKLGKQYDIADAGHGGMAHKQRGIFAGVNAKGADLKRQAAAEELSKRGIPMDYDSRMARAKEQGFSDNTRYRGLAEPYDDSKNPHLIWTTDNPEYASAYAYGGADKSNFGKGSNVLPVKVKSENPFDFGFRSQFTEVKFENVLDRVERGIIDSYKDGKLGRDEALDLRDEVLDLADADDGTFMPVFEWWNNKPEMIDILRRSGYDSISAKEGVNDDIETIALFNPNQMRSTNAAFNPADIGKNGLLKSILGAGLGYNLLSGGTGEDDVI